MLERQQQLLQQGLLDQGQQSPHQTASQFGSPPCHIGSPYDSVPSTSHNNYQMPNSMDQMEVDYQQQDGSQEPIIDTASIVQVS